MLLSRFSFAYAGLAICSATAIASSSSSTQVLLPKQTGVYHVGRSVAELVDYSRTEPFAPDVEPVKLMISVFYPVDPWTPSSASAYMPPETARFEDEEFLAQGLASPNGTFEKVALHLASSEPAEHFSHHAPHQHPLVVFMSAEGTTRLFYNQIASTVASNGFIVVTIDVARDVDIIQYLDGSGALLNGTVWNDLNETQAAKDAYIGIGSQAEDVSFVLDSLSNATFAHSLVPNLPPSGLNTTHTAMFGHSLGGTTAYTALHTDDRIRGAIDMDGGLFGPDLLNNTDKPFMFMAHANVTRYTIDPFHTWSEAWPHLLGWKRDVVVAGMQHYDFSDEPLVFETLGITPTPGGAVANTLHLGAMKGTRALQITTTYVSAFLDFVFYGECSPILDGPVAEFREVTFEY